MNIDVLKTLDFWLEVLRLAEKLEVRTKKAHHSETVRVIIKANRTLPYMEGKALEIKVDTQAADKGRIRMLSIPEKHKNAPKSCYGKTTDGEYEYVKGNTFYTSVSDLAGVLFAEFLKKAAEYSKLDELEKAYALFETCNK